MTLLLGLGACSESALNTALSRSLPADIRDADDAFCPQPQCLELRVPHPETVRVSDDRVRVILPASYAETDRSYPLLLLLHDAPGNYRSWTEEGEVYARLQAEEVIVVMPDGGGGNPGWYSDWLDGSFHWEQYHLEYLLPWVESTFRVLGPAHRAVAGPSMGGHGAMKYAAQYPGSFKAAAGFSGAVDFLHLDRVSALYTFLGNPIAGTPNGPIWGDPVTNFPIWEDQDPGTHVEGLRETKVYLSSGNGLPGGPHEDLSNPSVYAIEPLLLLMNQSFAQALAAAGIEHETWFYGPGFHDWPYYRDAFDWAWGQIRGDIGVE